MAIEENKLGKVKRENIFVRLWHVLHMVIFINVVVLITIFSAVIINIAALVSRKLVRIVGRIWYHTILFAGGVRLKVIGKEKLDKNERYVFMSNHQSALDIPIIYAGIGAKICFIAKKELFAVPVFGWGMSAMGHISIDRENARKAHASILKAVAKLKKDNVSLILFPEGTRSKTGEVLEFKTASFALAIHAGVKLVPVAIKGAIDRLPPKSKRIVSGVVTLEIGDPIDVETIAGMNKNDLCNKVRDAVKSMVES